MSAPPFRFQPPDVPVTRALRWVLARAYSARDTLSSETEGDLAVDLARSLGIAARIAAVQSPDRLAGELGPPAAAELKKLRAQATAQEMRLGAALAAVDAAAADLRIPYAPLKGQALGLGGFAPDGGRPASDVDLLVPIPRLESLHGELVRQGFTVAGEAYEHQAPALRHAGGGLVELHRMLPGVRLGEKRPSSRSPGRSASFDALAAAGLFGPPPSGMKFRPRGDLRLPRREILTAHALVHALAQHAFAPHVFPGFLFLGDLVDLGFRGTAGRATLAGIAPWIEREVRFEEAEAALDLATALAAGDSGLFESSGAQRSRARLLLDHFHAGVADPQYAMALKSRLLERPLSDKPQVVAKAELLARTLAPRQGESAFSRLRTLAGRFFAARAAGKRR
jgi:hypothetical protein